MKTILDWGWLMIVRNSVAVDRQRAFRAGKIRFGPRAEVIRGRFGGITLAFPQWEIILERINTNGGGRMKEHGRGNEGTGEVERRARVSEAA